MEKPPFTNRHYNTSGHAHELTYSCYRRSPYFNDPLACRLFLDSVRRAQIKFNFHLWAYIIMPNHVHLLIWPCDQEYDISKILQAINGAMSRRYSRLLRRINPSLHSTFFERDSKNHGFRFWQRGGGFDRNLFNDKAIYDSIRYIENNPVRAKIVQTTEQYNWSSAWHVLNPEKFRPKINRGSVPVRMVNRY
ncbi:MAG: hypothetical protein GX639_14270 [Fibrobacter sp.]|nr:hypothetical protein [Fibrobacter sp.]